MPHSRILSPNDPRIKDSEKFKQWKAEKEKKLAAERKREEQRKEAEAKHREEIAEQRKGDFETYVIIRECELLVEHVVRKAVDVSEKRQRDIQERERKEIVEEVMANWTSKKIEEDKKEKRAQKQNKIIQDFLERSQLLQELRDNYQQVMDDSWNFQKWFEHELDLRENNLMRYMDNDSIQGSGSRRSSKVRPSSTASTASSRTSDGFYTSWNNDRKLIRKLKKTIETPSGGNEKKQAEKT